MSSGALPAVYYPGPLPAPPPDGESDSDSDSESGDEAPRDNAPYWKVITRAALAAVLVLLVILVAHWARGAGPKAGAALEDHLAGRGWVVHLLRGCRHCERQAKTLPRLARIPGASVTCPDRLACKGIAAFPFWHNTRTGETKIGFQDFPALRLMAGL